MPRLQRPLLLVKVDFYNFCAIGEMIAQPRVQRTRARYVREQVFHLVSKDTSPFELDVLGVRRRKWYCDQLHRSLLRRATTFVVIAATTSCRDVIPGIPAAS